MLNSQQVMKKIALTGIILLFSIALVLTLFLRSDFVSEKVKDLAIKELEHATQHSVRIEKAVLNLIPLYIELKGIELTDKKGSPIINIKRTKGYIGLGRLFKKEFSIRVKASEPYLIIERDEEGLFNLSPLIDSIQRYLKEEKKVPVNINFKGLSTEKGEIDFLDKKVSLSIHGKGLSFKMRTGLVREGFRINAVADELKVKFRTFPDLILKAEAKLKGKENLLRIEEFKVTNVGSSIGLEGGLNISEKPGIDIKTSITLIAKSFKDFFGLKDAPKGEIRITGNIKGDLPMFEGQGARGKGQGSGTFPEADLDVKAEIPVSLIKGIIKKEADIEGTINVEGNIKGSYPELTSRGELSLSEGGISGIRIKKIGSEFSSQFTVHGSQFTFPEIKGEILDGTVEGRLAAVLNPPSHPFSKGGDMVDFRLESIEGDGWLRYMKGRESGVGSRETRISPSIIENAEVTFSSREGILTIAKGNISTPLSSAEFSGSLSLKTLEGEFPFTARSDNFGEWSDPYYKGTKGSIDITGEITGPIVNPAIDGRAEIRSAGVKGVSIQRAYGGVKYKEKMISVSGFQVEQESSTYLIDGSIRFGTEGPYYDAKANIKNGNPRKITSIFYKDLPIDTSINGEMTFRGGNFVYEGDASLHLNKGRAYGQDFDNARVRANLKRVQGEKGEVNFSSIQVEKGGDTLYADGRIGFDESFHGMISSKRITLGNINILNPAPSPHPALAKGGQNGGKEGLGGFTSIKITGKGTFKNPEIFADLKLDKVSYMKSSLGEGDMAVSLKDTSLKVLTRVGGVRLEGEMAIIEDLPWNAGLFLKDLRLDDFFIKDSNYRDQNSKKASIAATGYIKAAGKGADLGVLSVTSKLSSISLDIFGYKINNDGDAEIVLKNRDLRVHSLRFKGQDGSSIEIGGDLRLNDFYNIYLYGKADLGLLRPFIPQIESLNGDGEFMVALSDRWHDPRIQGMINFKNGTVKIKYLPQRIGKLSGNLTFEKDRVILDSLKGEIGGGRLDFSGFAVLKGLSFRNFYIQGKADNVRYRYFEGLTTTFDGKLVYEGDAKSQTLSGEVIFKKALYTRRIDWKSWLLEIRKIEEKPKAEVSPLMNTNFNIYLSGKVDVDNNIGKGPVNIDLLLKGTPIRPLLFGRIESTEGQIFFRNNSFRVLSTSADFFDPNRIYPVFNVVAVTELKGYRIHLSLSGPIDRFSLSLSSDPPLSETDLIALLTVGQPTKGLKGLEAGVGAGEAASFLTGKIQDVLEERFRNIAGLDRFQVDPYVTSSSSAGGPRLTVGKTLIDGRLYMTYSANIGTSEEQVIRLEYILGRNVFLVGVRDEQGQVGGDLKFRFEFR